MKRIILVYLLIINLLTFFFYGIDKWKAKRGRWRIPEDTLLGLAAIGGALGAFCGMRVWHHKTLKRKFSIGVPALLIIEVLILAWLLHI